MDVEQMRIILMMMAGVIVAIGIAVWRMSREIDGIHRSMLTVATILDSLHSRTKTIEQTNSVA